jgi:hypothetical protein
MDPVAVLVGAGTVSQGLCPVCPTPTPLPPFPPPPQPRRRFVTPPPPHFSVTASASGSPQPSKAPYFSFWNGNTNSNYSAWWDPLDVNVNVSFLTVTEQGQELVVQVDWADHFSINLFASPEYIQVASGGWRRGGAWRGLHWC